MTFYHETCQPGPEASTPFFDWLGVLGSPHASDQARQSPEDASGSVESFDHDIDFLRLDLDNQTNMICLPGVTIANWQSVFNTTSPFAHGPAPDPFADSLSSCEGTIYSLLSVTSDGTTVNSPTHACLSEFKLPPVEDALVDHHVTSSSSPPLSTDTRFTFFPPALHMQPVMFEANSVYGDNGQFYSPEQLPSQPMVGAANVVVPDLAMGVEANVDNLKSTFIPKAATHPPLQCIPPKHPHNTLVVEKKPTCPTGTKRPRVVVDDDNDSSASKDDAPPKRKRKRQDTTKRIPCPCPECPESFSRTNNAEVHYNIVHLGLRPFPCTEPGCDHMPFGRKHDLQRHHQSKHTDLGSPRNVKNPKPGNRKNVKKITRKDNRNA